jgi:WD40 repeat protein
VLAVCCAGGLVSLLDAKTFQLLRRLEHKEASVTSLAFTPDSKTLITSAGSTLRWWDLGTGTLTQQVPQHDLSLFALSPDGKLLAVSRRDLVILRSDTGARVTEIPGGSWRHTELAWSPDGKYIATLGRSTVEVTDVERARTTKLFQEPGGNPLAMQVTGNGEVLIRESGWLQRWNLATRKKVGVTSYRGFEGGFVLSPDGRFLVSGQGSKTLAIYDPKKTAPLHTLNCRHTITALSLLADGQSVAVGTDQGLVTVYDLQTGKNLTAHLAPLSPIHHIALSFDDRYLAAAADNGVYCWDLRTGMEKQRIAVNAGKVTDIAFRPHSSELLAATSRGRSPVWDVGWEFDTPLPLYRLPTGEPLDVSAGKYSLDGKWIVTSERGGHLQLWNAENGSLVGEMKLAEKGVDNLAFLPGSTLLAAGDVAGKIEVWDVGERARRFQIVDAPARLSLAFSPTGGTLAMVPITHQGVELWDVYSRQRQCRFRTVQSPVRAIIAPDGRRLASAEIDHCIRTYDLATGQQLSVFRGHTGTIRALAFDSRGARLVSGGIDSRLLVWDATVGRAPELPKSRLAESELQEQWRLLRSFDAEQAYEARWKLLATPEQTISRAERHLEELTKRDSRIARWVAELDHEEFGVREAASAALEEMGEPVLPALRKLVTDAKSAEVRRRAEEVVGAIAAKRLVPGAADARVLELLETIGNTQARKLLEQFAKKGDALMATQARLALGRLKQREGR